MNICTNNTSCTGSWPHSYLKGKRWVFNFDLKEARDGAWRIEGGILFQDKGPATEKRRDSIVFRRRGRGIVREEGSEEERSERNGM